MANTVGSLKQIKNSALYSNAFFLMMNSISTSLLGFVFWNIMTRFFSPAQVGIGSALVTGSMLLGNLANLGLGTGLVRFVPEKRQEASQLVNVAFTITGIIALIVSLLYLAGIAFFTRVLEFIAGHVGLEFFFILFTVGTALSIVIDQALLARSAARLVFQKNFLVCLLKIPLPVLLLAKLEGYGIFAATGIAILMGVVLSCFFFLPRVYKGYAPRPLILMEPLKLMVAFSFFNYLAYLFNSGPGLLYPTLVLIFCGSHASAYFYIAWMMAMVLSVIPAGMSQSLFAAGSQTPRELQCLAGRSLYLSLLLSLAGAGGMLLAGKWFLNLFGSDYYENGSKVLWVLSASVIPHCINSSFLAINQVKKKVSLITAQAGLHAAVALGLGVLLLRRIGPEGLAWGYLLAHLIVAILVTGPLRGFLKADKGGEQPD